MIKITWTEFDIVRRIKKWADINIQETPSNKKDFYNFYTGTVVCGMCRKELRPIRSLFHYHLKK